MDKNLKIALRGATTKLADFVANNFIALFLGVCLNLVVVVVARYWNWNFWCEQRITMEASLS